MYQLLDMHASYEKISKYKLNLKATIWITASLQVNFSSKIPYLKNILL